MMSKAKKMENCMRNPIYNARNLLRRNMDCCHDQSSQIANLVTAEVQSNHMLHNHFGVSFPPLCSQSIILLIREITRLTMKSAINRFLNDNSLKPTKQSLALRVTQPQIESSSASSSSIRNQTLNVNPRQQANQLNVKRTIVKQLSVGNKQRTGLPATVVMGGSSLHFASVTQKAVAEGEWFCSMSINERGFLLILL